jgi:hypothetical protein
MAAAGKGKSEGLLGITQSDARILLLGILSADNAGKVGYVYQQFTCDKTYLTGTYTAYKLTPDNT